MNNKSASNKKYRMALRQMGIKQLGGKCVKCGSKHNLEFHHRNPLNKVASIAYIIRTHPSLLAAELEKCELRCHKCHVKYHKSTIWHFYYVKKNPMVDNAIRQILG